MAQPLCQEGYVFFLSFLVVYSMTAEFIVYAQTEPRTTDSPLSGSGQDEFFREGIVESTTNGTGKLLAE